MKNLIDSFTCPNCGGHGIYEAITNVTVSRKLILLCEDGTVKYAKPEEDSWEVLGSAHYECSNCDRKIVEASSWDELIEYLKKNPSAKG